MEGRTRNIVGRLRDGDVLVSRSHGMIDHAERIVQRVGLSNIRHVLLSDLPDVIHTISSDVFIGVDHDVKLGQELSLLVTQHNAGVSR